MKKMQFIRNLSIKNKIIAIVLFVGFIVLTTGFTIIAKWETDNYSKKSKENLILTAKLIGDYCVVPLYFGDKEQGNEALKRLKFLDNIEEGYLFDNEENLFASYPDSLKNRSRFDPEKGSSADLVNGHFIVSEPVYFKGDRLGIIYVKANTAELNLQKRKLIITFLLLGLALLVFSFLIASRVQKLISDPILRLTKLTEAISRNQDFSVQAKHSGTDELGLLYEQFNNMLAQILVREEERDRAQEEILNLNANLERKVAERTALLESANKELETFSYSVSHDLRAPLRHINGYLELLMKKNTDQLDEKGKHYIKSIHESSSHMGHLIDDLLNFSRTGRMEMKLDTIDMNNVIKDALSILEEETKDRKIEWKIDPMPKVFADYTMMRQVWVNLLSNAIKYTGKRETALIQTGWRTENNNYIFFVKDNGAGFDARYAQKLFGVFQRLHSNEEFEGTGIGLANVRQVIHKHGGRCWAEGEVDKGATFYFTLPKQ